MGTTVEKKDPVEVLVVIAVLVLGVAIGPLLAIRNPAEADKLTPGGRPGRRVEQGAGRQRKLHRVANAQAHRGSAVATKAKVSKWTDQAVM
jgi:hypothetical protein